MCCSIRASSAANWSDGKAVALGPNGLVYYAASTFGTQFPVAGEAINQFPSGNYDIVLGAFDLTQSGVNTWCTALTLEGRT